MPIIFTVVDSTGLNADLVAKMQVAANEAANRVGRYLSGTATIEVTIDITSIDANGSGRGGGRSTTSALVGSTGGLNLFQQGASYELATGIDPNGADRDIDIWFMPNYIRNELQFDPTPSDNGFDLLADRGDMVSVIEHELIHALSFNGWRNYTTGALPGNCLSTFDQNIDTSGSTFQFKGAWTVATLGAPVNLTRGNIYHYGNVEDNASDLIKKRHYERCCISGRLSI